MLKECLFCKTEFFSEHKVVRFCSDLCRRSDEVSRQPKSPEHSKRTRKAQKAIKRLEMTQCTGCGIAFVPSRRFRQYCSASCLGSHQRRRQGHGILSKNGINSSEIGAISELRVCADLLQLGYEVFRSVSPTCSFDVVAHDGVRLWRVEIRTGYRGVNGSLHAGKHKRADVLAVYVPLDNSVVYDPPLPAIPRPARLAAKQGENRPPAARPESPHVA